MTNKTRPEGRHEIKKRKTEGKIQRHTDIFEESLPKSETRQKEQSDIRSKAPFKKKGK
jgi:hypothetical protein